jgi:DNA-binding NtrC family response regulator
MTTTDQVLVIDDDEFWREDLQGILEGAGFKVAVAEDRNLALNELKNNTFKVVVIDVNLGTDKRGGILLSQYIKNHNLKLAIILISAQELGDKDRAAIGQTIFINKANIVKQKQILVEAVKGVLLNHT